MVYCSYFQATVSKKETWFFVATLRSNEHLMFDRTFDVEQGIFEFFVPCDNVARFINIMRYYEQQGIIRDFKELPNRLITEDF